MDIETAFAFVSQYGYFALFFILWIGFFSIPVPNEVIVMTSGFVTSKSYLSTIPALIVTFFGIVMSLTTLYFSGRFFFSPIQKKLQTRPKLKEHIEKANSLIEKYGPFSLIIGYLFPGVRHFVPFIIGSNKMSFRIFALYAYSTAAVWTGLFFFLGFYFGTHMDQILKIVYLLGIPVLLISLLTFMVYKGKKKKKTSRELS
ncbi:DedA family protein [Bacillus suaedaesalsae]|uniref:DedA family protein n=1 Tax=Bacillus suaedaesalsae TaxID=2810349 RepID=A0ABS2DI31_9BACI|nr:DedA family protein [Bacillus suaedaesalsae]MBM6618108.1 DedA family protein [Bacillus suaedaesalsae]